MIATEFTETKNIVGTAWVVLQLKPRGSGMNEVPSEKIH